MSGGSRNEDMGIILSSSCAQEGFFHEKCPVQSKEFQEGVSLGMCGLVEFRISILIPETGLDTLPVLSTVAGNQ